MVNRFSFSDITVISELKYFCSKINTYVVRYRSKDKNITQDNHAELVDSPVAPRWESYQHVRLCLERSRKTTRYMYFFGRKRRGHV